jgi:hypothetical protein
LAKGADPPEAFQVFIGTYIPFFNEDDEACNDISWNLWSSTIKLDKKFRTRLNVMVENVNAIIREAADGMKAWGVYYVDNYQRSFDGHRFCDVVPDFDGKTDLYVKQYHSQVFQDYGAQTYFWSWKSQWDPPAGPNGQGDEHPINYFGDNAAQTGNVTELLEILIPDEGQRAQVAAGEDPSKFNPDAFKDVQSLKTAMQNIQTTDDAKKKLAGLFTNDGFFRIWHPKQQAHTHMANGFFDIIKGERSWDFKDNAPAPPPASSKPEYQDHCADTTKYAKFDYGRAEKDIQDFCKGGMVRVPRLRYNPRSSSHDDSWRLDRTRMVLFADTLQELTLPAAPLWNTYDHTKDDINMKLQIAIQWSASGQDGCNAYNGSHVDENVCVDKFLAAMNRCNTDTIENKYGQYPMTWSGPSGCVDFWLVGHGPDWACTGLGQTDPECKGQMINCVGHCSATDMG